MQHTLNYRTEWIEMINTLPDTNDRNALIAAITMYQFNGQMPELSPVLNLVFLFIKKEIDLITQQLEAIEARKEARRARRTARPRTPKAPKPAIHVESTAEAAVKNAVEPTVEAAVENAPITEMPESPELPESPEKPEKPELPELPEKPEMPEMPESPELPEMPAPKSNPPSKNKKFNAILRAKDRHKLHQGIRRRDIRQNSRYIKEKQQDIVNR